MRLLKRTICLVMTLFLLCMLQPLSADAASYKNTYQNTGNHRADIIGVARTQIGYTEGRDNANKYGSWYRMNNESWCAIFISWCARQANIPVSILKNCSIASPNTSVGGVTSFDLTYYDGLEYTPLPGDLFFTKDCSHVGLVYYIDGDHFFTIEGNSNTAGSNNGDRVTCNRRKISDYYFGVPAYDTTAQTPVAPKVTADRKNYRQGENNTGDTIVLSWDAAGDEVARQLTVYFKGDVLCQQDMGLDSGSYTLENAMAGAYLVSASSQKADGSTAYGQFVVHVADPYTLTLRYHIGGGQVSAAEKYKVIDNILYLRANTNTYSTRLMVMTKNTVFTVTEKTVSWDFIWGKTVYAGAVGWAALGNKLVERTGYYSDINGLIHAYPDGALVQTRWEYAKGSANGLPDADALDLSREYYTFVGWSRSPDGTGTIIPAKDASITTEDIRPDFRYEDITLDLYAVWQKNVDRISICTPPDKTFFQSGETLDLTGLSLNVHYADGSLETISTGYTVTEPQDGPIGQKTILVKYRGASLSLMVSTPDYLVCTPIDGGVTIDSYIAADGEMLLPNAVDGSPVCAITGGAFLGNTNMTGVLIPNTVTAIGENAFAGCSGLETVYFMGTQEQWDSIIVESGNDALLNAQLQGVCKHSYSDWEVVDETTHSRACIHCNNKTESGHHEPGHEPTASKSQNCTVCGYILQPALNHVHSPSESWYSDGNSHWRSCPGCSEQLELTAHQFENDCDTLCEECGYTRQTSHVFYTEWSFDEEYHYTVCRGCGKKNEVAVHTPGDPATEFNPQSCTVCGYTIAEALGHSYATFWSWDEASHFHACDCGDRTDAAPHSWDTGVENHGVLTYTCTVCGTRASRLAPADWRLWVLLGVPFLLGCAVGVTTTCLLRRRRRG